MNIGFVGNIPPPIGGAEIFLKAFLSRFLKTGTHTGTLLRWGRQISPVAPQAGVQNYAPLGYRERFGSLTTYSIFDSSEKSSEKDPASNLLRINHNQGNKAALIFKRHRVELIHAHMLTNLPYAAIAAKSLSIPLVVSVHGMLEFKLQSRLRARCPELADLVDQFLIQADLILGISSEIVDTCIGKGAQRIEKLSCGIDTTFFSLPNNLEQPGNDIVFIGSIREDKGAPLLIDAFEHIQNSLDCNLVLVGRRYIDCSAIKRAQLNPRIHFRGAQSADGVRQALSQAKLVVLPSESEGLPLSILEAMSCQRPVLVSNTGELSSLIEHGQNGFLIKERTLSGLARQIQDIVERDDLYQVGRRARSMADRFNIDRVVDSHEEIYSSLLSRNNRYKKSICRV